MKSILMSMLAVATLASCNQQKGDNDLDGAPQALKLQFSNVTQTRTIDTPASPGTIAASDFASATIYFLNSTGGAASQANYTMDAADIATAASSGLIIEQVTADVASIVIKAKKSGGEEMTSTSNINSYQKTFADIETFSYEGSALATWNGVDMIHGTHKLYKASVDLYPAFARIEVLGGIDAKPAYSLGALITDVSGNQLYEHKYDAAYKAANSITDDYYYSIDSTLDLVKDDATYTPVAAKKLVQKGLYSAEVDSIYVNNVYLTYGATTHIWNQDVPMGTWKTAYTTGGTHENMCDVLGATNGKPFGAAVAAGTGHWWMTSNSAPIDRNVGIEAGKTAAYQIFPQSSTKSDKFELAAELPHVIVKLNIVKVKGQPAERVFVNIRNFRNDANTEYIKSFEAGKIYSFSLDELSSRLNEYEYEIVAGKVVEVTPPPVTPDPDPDTNFDLEVKVTIKNWIRVNVLPEIND